ncbi:hypothetical protein BKA93DRAFT_726427 [Sparassis latifolia]
MKYPLAIIDKLIKVYGFNIKVGYDIVCAFAKMLARSSLGPSAAKAGVSGVVPTFHGHGHNRGCQVHWHPLYMTSVGKEDFKGCERCFSESNTVAPGMRLASPFHHHQVIEQFFEFWDEQKHIESGNFIYNNYKQALTIIEQDLEILNVLSQELKTGPADYERFLKKEQEYLSGLKVEPPELVRKINYMKTLKHLEDTGWKCEQAHVKYKNLNYNIIVDGYKKKEISKVQTLYRTTTYNRYQDVTEQARLIEEELSLVERWMPGMPEYMTMAEELGRCKYRCALNNLECLVV